jgi:phosphatidate cytidylyltransferase
MALGNLAQRAAVALVAAPLLILGIYQSDPIFTWALVFVASLLTMSEFFAMTIEDRFDRIISLLFGVATVAAFYWLGTTGETMPGFIDGHILVLILGVVGPMLYYLFRFGDMSTVAPRLAYSVTGIFYAGILVTFIALVRRDFGYEGTQLGSHLVILLLITAWLADTGGYFAGKAIGGAKLYEAVSPNKTWAGSIGGTLCSIAGGVAFKLTLAPELSWVDVLLLTGVGSIIGQLGDLGESLIKRSTGVKDSGAILPGHGGMLDRVDALLLIAPYYYLYLSISANL